MLTRSKTKELLREKTFEKVTVDGDGDCLFSCISLAVDIPVSRLRKIVALSIYDVRNEEAVMTWKEIYCANQKDERVTHLKGVDVDTPTCINSKELDIIYKNMLKSTYWGDEYCIKILSEFLSLTMVVRDDDSGRMWYPTKRNLNYTIYLNYENENHYNLLSVNNKYLV